MSLSSLLADRAAAGHPVRIGLIGAGKFGTLFLAQARHTPGLHLAALADSDDERGPTALALAQWPPAKAVARSLADAVATGGTWVTTEPLALFEQTGLDVVIDTTGNAIAAIRHALAAIGRGVHVIMGSIEADALAGPLLARRARDRGVIYSLAYGDQPALVCELVDWARACGFEVAAAGKGTKWLPGYQATTPDTVWPHYGVTPEKAKAGGMSPHVYTAFVDGTRTALELASVANATGLAPPSTGLAFPACGAHDLARMLKPTWDGGRIEAMGQVEAVSSMERDGRHVIGDLRWGVYVTFRTPSTHTGDSFAEYGLITDDSGQYAARWRPHRLAGLELGVSVVNVVLRREPTGCPTGFVADVVAVAKRDLAAGERLDGIGSFTVWGKLLPASAALAQDALPIGLTDNIILTRPVAVGRVLTWADVALDEHDDVVSLRREMERTFR